MRGRNVRYTLDSRVLALAFMGVAASCGSSNEEDPNYDASSGKDVHVTDRDTGMPTGPTGPIMKDGSSGSDVGNNPVPDANGMDAHNGMPDAHDVPDANDADANNGMDAHSGIPDGGTHDDGGQVVTNNPPTLDPRVPPMYQIPIGSPLIFQPKGEDPDVGDRLEYRADVLDMIGNIVYSTQWNNSREVPIMLSGMASQDLILALYLRDMSGNEVQRDVPVRAVTMSAGQGAKPIARGCKTNERNTDGNCSLYPPSGQSFCINAEDSYHPDQSRTIVNYWVYPRKGGPAYFGGPDPRVCFRANPRNSQPITLEGELVVEDERGVDGEGVEPILLNYNSN